MTQLVRYEQARTALAEAHRVDEVKDIRDKAQAMAAYARQANDTAMVEWATEIKVRAERRCGELLRDSAKNGGRDAGRGGDRKSQSDDATVKPPTLADIGLTKDQSSRFQKLAAIPETKFEQAVAAAKETAREVTTAALLRLGSQPHVTNNSGENEWYTPPDLLERARGAMGGIDCDPASCEVANRNVRAEVFYSAADDGLNQKWHGRVWLNPPYSNPLCGQFCEALAKRALDGEIEQACVLVNNATETGWFGRLVSVASAMCLLQGRVRYLDSSGRPANAPLQGQAVIYVGPRVKEFAAAFAGAGRTWIPYG